MKHLGMRLTSGLRKGIFGQTKTARLQPFLQARLGILALMRGIDRAYLCVEQTLDDAACHIEAGIQHGSPEQRFERVGEDGWPLRAAALQLAFTQAQMATEFQLQSNVMQGVLIDQIGAQAGQAAFRLYRKALIKHQSDDAIEYAIAQELQSLVVASAETAMRQRLIQQFALTP